MSNKTLIPAFEAHVGDWSYYMCVMKYAEVARQIEFAYMLGANSDLSTMIQRGISKRADEIREYLLQSEHRFLGALIVAVHGGEPQFSAIDLDFQDSPLRGTDRAFGFLTFDGSQQYFALDGQHRLQAIKDAITKDPSLAKDDISVLLVPHYDTDEGKERTRRLFTNINRNAKSTTTAENIALDEDDGFAIISRRLVSDHPFLGRDGVVRIYTRQGEDGDLRLAGASVPKTELKAVTTLQVLYDMCGSLGFGLAASYNNSAIRPTTDELEEGYKVLATRFDELFRACGRLVQAYESKASARDLRAPKSNESEGHAMMRPVVQRVVCDVLRDLLAQDRGGGWKQLLERLGSLEWQLGKAPWRSVWDPEQGKMLSAKDNKELLAKMLKCHLAPSSKSEITRARQSYKMVRREKYPFAEEELARNVVLED